MEVMMVVVVGERKDLKLSEVEMNASEKTSAPT